MFTGIIEELGTVVEAAAGTLRVAADRILQGTKLGDSIAVQGVDLTVAAMQGAEMAFDVMPETYRVTNLNELRPGDPVNLERSVRSEDRLSGHIVRGVVEGTCRLESLRQDGPAVIATFSAPNRLLDHIILRGPVCLDGVSLSVMQKTERTFSVSLVRYTQLHTILLDRQVGALVNVETDIMIRYVSKLLEARGLLPSRDPEDLEQPSDTVAAWHAFKSAQR
jgi:riboflavin synthase